MASGHRAATQRRRTWALAGSCVVLALIIALELWRGAGVPASSPQRIAEAATDTSPAQVEGPLRFAELERYAATVERPLFRASRRPAPTTPDTRAAEVPVKPAQYRLTGVVLTPAKQIVVLQDKSSGRMVSVHKGETVADWVVEEVHAQGATIRSGRESRDLGLVVNGAERAEAQAPVQQPGPKAAAALKPR